MSAMRNRIFKSTNNVDFEALITALSDKAKARIDLEKLWFTIINCLNIIKTFGAEKENIKNIEELIKYTQEKSEALCTTKLQFGNAIKYWIEEAQTKLNKMEPEAKTGQYQTSIPKQLNRFINSVKKNSIYKNYVKTPDPFRLLTISRAPRRAELAAKKALIQQNRKMVKNGIDPSLEIVAETSHQEQQPELKVSRAERRA